MCIREKFKFPVLYSGRIDTDNIKGFGLEGLRQMLWTVTCVNILSAIAESFHGTCETGFLKSSWEFWSVFRVLNPRLMIWDQEVSKPKWEAAVWFGGNSLLAKSRGFLPRPWLWFLGQCLFLEQEGVKGQDGNFPKVPPSSDMLGSYNPRSDLYPSLPSALSSGNLQKEGRGVLMKNPFTHFSEARKQGRESQRTEVNGKPARSLVTVGGSGWTGAFSFKDKLLFF